VKVYLMLLASAICAAAGQMLFRVGAAGRTALLEFVNPALLGGLTLYAASTLLWVFALSRLPLRSVYPFTALTFVLVYGGAILLLDEKPSWRGIVGVVIVLVGLYCIVTDR
jgi:drug/metabolite transporter (DMT)-like permease